MGLVIRGEKNREWANINIFCIWLVGLFPPKFRNTQGSCHNSVFICSMIGSENSCHPFSHQSGGKLKKAVVTCRSLAFSWDSNNLHGITPGSYRLCPYFPMLWLAVVIANCFGLWLPSLNVPVYKGTSDWIRGTFKYLIRDKLQDSVDYVE